MAPEPLDRQSVRAVCQGCGAELPPPQRAAGQRQKWCSERCRKLQYAGHCVDCGTTINTDGRVADAATRCVPCAARASGAERKVWTRTTLIGAISRWVQVHGELPKQTEWRGHGQRSTLPGDWPSHNAVVREFGSWNDGITAAGFSPRQVGRPRKAAA